MSRESVYKCDVCGKACNGSGLSYSMSADYGYYEDQPATKRKILWMQISLDLAAFSKHACGHDHLCREISAELTKIETGQ